jgi:hypothetical protein
LVAAWKKCDAYADAAKRAFVRGNSFLTYRAAKNAELGCLSAADDIKAIQYGPAFNADARVLLDHAKQECVDAIGGGRAAQMGRVAQFMNGDQRPSDADTVAQMATLTDYGVAGCVMDYRDAASRSGLPVSGYPAKPGMDNGSSRRSRR